MPKDDFYTPTDIDALRMENELLTFEVRFLKSQLADPERTRMKLEARLAESEQSRAQLEARLAESEQARAQLEAQSPEAESPRADLEARLEGVETDLVYLLGSLVTSPLGRFLRRREEFRALEQRYISTDD